MKRLAMMVAVVTMLVAGVYAQDQGRLLKAAMNTENVDGNLKLAIEQYKKAAEGSDRALSAQALLRMAECYQKLGDAEATKVYERIVRDYADQKDAVAAARRYIDQGGQQTRGVENRQVWKPCPDGSCDVFGNVSSDGRYVAFTNYDAGGDLFLRDLTTNTDRRLTNDEGKGELEFGFATFSRDSKQLAYSWFDYQSRRYSVRLVGLQGSGVRELFTAPADEFVAPYDWSPDGGSIAIGIANKDRTGLLALLSTRDGSLQVFKPSTWETPLKMFFSPDGKHLAFDLADPGYRGRDVFILRIADKQELPVVTRNGQNRVIGWSPDSRRVLFTSNKSGTLGMWAATVSNGEVRGELDLIRRTVEGFRFLHPMGITTSGAFYSMVSDRGTLDVYTADFDFEQARFSSRPSAVKGTGNTRLPEWSRDGTSLAYRSGVNMEIRTLATGEVRELPLPSAYRMGSTFTWTAEGDGFIATATDPKGVQGLFRIDGRTGQFSMLVEGRYAQPVISPDGRFLYYSRYDLPTTSFAILQRDLASGTTLEVAKNLRIGTYGVSPDGRYLASAGRLPEGGSVAHLIPIAGGGPRELLRSDQPLSVQMWAPDSGSVYITKEARDVWRVPVTVGQPQKLAFSLDRGMGQFRVHPDGRQIAVQVSGPRTADGGLWVLERFLPPVLDKP